jgi:hypothetical protein
MNPAPVTEHSADLLARFDRDGFVGPFQLDIPRARFARVAARIDDMLERASVHPLYGRFSVRDWHLLDDELLSILSDGRIVETLIAILGPRVASGVGCLQRRGDRQRPTRAQACRRAR